MEETASTEGYRLSDLPENVIHCIMSFLSPAEFSRLSTLSKRLSSLGLSFPSLDFKFRYSPIWKFDHDEVIFLDFVRNALERRRTLETNFERLSFHVFLCKYDRITTDDYKSALIGRLNNVTQLIDQNLIKFALEKKITELNLYCGGDYEQHSDLEDILASSCVKRLPNYAIFSAKTIKSLKLSGLMLGSNLFLACPLIEDFALIHCNGLRSVKVSSCAKLIKKISIHCCAGLERIHVNEEANLESFTYISWTPTRLIGNEEREMVDIKLDSHKSLKLLELRKVDITDEWFEKYVSKSELLETLILFKCQKLKNLSIRNENLKCLELKDCDDLENVDIAVSGLKSFRMYEGRLRYGQPPCKINIYGCKLLAYLRYQGRLKPSPPVVLISSNIKDVEICLAHFSNRAGGFHKMLSDFLGCFAHCDTVFLSDYSNEHLIYPEQVRKTLIPPLYDVKHLQIQATIFRSKGIVELVDSLLWFSPHPEMISFLEYSILDGTEKTKYIIKFYYGVSPNSEVKEDAEKNDVHSCCSLSPVRCWRHDLMEVAIDQNLEDSDRTSLRSYFMENAKAKITFV